MATIDELCVNTIRTLSIDAIQKANSGHPGLPLGAAPMAYALWQEHLCPRSECAQLAQPRSFCALGRTREHAAVFASAPERVRVDSG